MEPSSKAEILRQLQVVMKELFDLDADRVQPGARLIVDLELDSLDAIDLAVKVEETTGLVFDEAKVRQLRTVEDVLVAMEAIVGTRGATLPSSAPALSDS